MVDAQYYANLVDDYFLDVHSLDWIVDCGYSAMQSVAHFDVGYDNAFWNGIYVVYGDGSGSVFRELSGGLDVVAHEYTHGITTCTSNLTYFGESGALNESFSDILGNGAEFYADVNGLDAGVSPDWQIGEDVYVAPTAVPGFRNMQDPEEENHPDHYSERFIGFEDNGGVHWNSGIPNHAYYLLVNGGLNASCASPGDHNSTHCTGSETPVTGIGLADAEKIAFLGFAGMASYSLTSGSSMADARAATEAAAEALFGSSSQQLQSTSDAWTAVGVSGPQTCNVPDAVIPFQSANPYGNLIDCTWTYNNGSPDFSLHFSVGELELNYDYLYIYDGNDNLLETLTGSFGGHTSVNIPTSAALEVWPESHWPGFALRQCRRIPVLSLRHADATRKRRQLGENRGFRPSF